VTIPRAEFGYIRDLVYQHSAIVLEDGKEYLVESRLQPLMRREGYSLLGELITRLRSRPFDGLHWDVIEAMTNNETSFFRDVHPFEMLKKTVVPELISRRAAERQINIWCAASSSGQEPYSILILLREHFPALASWKVNLIASDISKEMIDRCRDGRYSQMEINRGLPAAFTVKYFERQGVMWQVKEDLRRMLQMRHINLAQAWPPLPPIDVIFVRNVLIYFDLDVKRSIMAKMKKVLRPDGYLFLGGAETTLNIDDAFERTQVERGVCYRLRAR
jgi:chemotaxis protein methyltransferase CheR